MKDKKLLFIIAMFILAAIFAGLLARLVYSKGYEHGYNECVKTYQKYGIQER